MTFFSKVKANLQAMLMLSAILAGVTLASFELITSSNIIDAIFNWNSPEKTAQDSKNGVNVSIDGEPLPYALVSHWLRGVDPVKQPELAKERLQLLVRQEILVRDAIDAGTYAFLPSIRETMVYEEFTKVNDRWGLKDASLKQLKNHYQLHIMNWQQPSVHMDKLAWQQPNNQAASIDWETVTADLERWVGDDVNSRKDLLINKYARANYSQISDLLAEQEQVAEINFNSVSSSAQVGQVIGPVKSGQQWLIYLITQVTQQPAAFENVQDQVLIHWRQTRAAEELNKRIDAFLEEREVDINLPVKEL